MKVGFASGPKPSEQAKKIYFSLEKMNFKPDFILYCFPRPKSIFHFNGFKSFTRNLFVRLVPTKILRIIFKNYLPVANSKIYYVKGINSDEALEVLSNERPTAVVVHSCGITGKRLCENFHNVLLNAHAGKLPEFRGMNNVEWAYLEDVPLIGTVHFIAPGIDKGDIVYEQELYKEKLPTSIDEIRQKAFEQVYDLFPKALKALQEHNFEPMEQTKARTTRYVMHSFLRRMLEKKLKSNKNDG